MLLLSLFMDPEVIDTNNSTGNLTIFAGNDPEPPIWGVDLGGTVFVTYVSVTNRRGMASSKHVSYSTIWKKII